MSSTFFSCLPLSSARVTKIFCFSSYHSHSSVFCSTLCIVLFYHFSAKCLMFFICTSASPLTECVSYIGIATSIHKLKRHLTNVYLLRQMPISLMSPMDFTSHYLLYSVFLLLFLSSLFPMLFLLSYCDS